MGQVHQKGKLNTPFEAKQRRSATPSSANQRQAGAKDDIAQEIRAIVKRRNLSRGETARLVGEPATQISLLLDGKLISFSAKRLVKIRDRLAGEAAAAPRRTTG
jgi:predicted XRE-type DNA-binding protein